MEMRAFARPAANSRDRPCAPPFAVLYSPELDALMIGGWAVSVVRYRRQLRDQGPAGDEATRRRVGESPARRRLSARVRQDLVLEYLCFRR